PGRIGRRGRARQLGDAERILEVGTDASRKRVGALAHEARIGTEEERRANPRVGSSEERGEARGRERHRLAVVVFSRYPATRVWISRASSWIARCRVSMSATRFAYSSSTRSMAPKERARPERTGFWLSSSSIWKLA